MSRKLRTILVDDEDLARQGLRFALAEYSDVEIIAECANGFDAVKAIRELKPDLLFLDIQMPKLDGFDVIELLGDDVPLVVFVTAYEQYALRAFETHPLDYLLKPVQPQRLQKTLEEVYNRLDGQNPVAFSDVVAARRSQIKPLARLLIREKSEVFIVATKDISHIEARGDYVAIHTADNYFIKNDRLNNLQQALDPLQFRRIHRSFLLNMDYLQKIETQSKDRRSAVLKTGKKLPVSRSGLNELMKFL